MKRRVHITATVDQPDLLKNLVEKLAYRRSDMRTHLTAKSNELDTSSTEAYVSGTMAMDYANGEQSEHLNIPFITCFAFTCLKVEGKPYELAWSQSLS